MIWLTVGIVVVVLTSCYLSSNAWTIFLSIYYLCLSIYLLCLYIYLSTMYLSIYLDDLIDCGDSSCCSHPVCAENILCVYFADPEQVIYLSNLSIYLSIHIYIYNINLLIHLKKYFYLSIYSLSVISFTYLCIYLFILYNYITHDWFRFFFRKIIIISFGCIKEGSRNIISFT